MGAWLDVNGEAIYGTKPGPIQGVGWCRSTAKPGKVYLHVFDWPADGVLDVDVPGVKSAYLLADPDRTALAVAGSGSRSRITAPATAPDSIDTVVVLVTE